MGERDGRMDGWSQLVGVYLAACFCLALRPCHHHIIWRSEKQPAYSGHWIKDTKGAWHRELGLYTFFFSLGSWT